ncbi:MAG: pyridoxamine 5'-phosphate oxidase family protein [Alloprevotella sp.]|nr:pyridoxamine 5'-phosphate oxidase family protein [Alloprevotella sp.]
MRQMRKAKRQRDARWALDVMDKAPYITLSMTRPDGIPYGLPLNIVRRDDTTFYFHCAHEGEKIDCLRHNPIVSLSAVSRCQSVYEEEDGNFTEHFRSAIALGRAEMVRDTEEKAEALRLISQRFLPAHMAHFDTALARSIDNTAVVKITLLEPPVGKSKG